MSPGLLSPMSQFIPPEARNSSPTPHCDGQPEERWRRFAEDVDNGLLYDPDRSAPGHLDCDESIQLDRRGITPQTRECGSEPTKKERQVEFWRYQTAQKNSIAAKLREAGMHLEADKLEDCHSRYTVCHCHDCSITRKFPNRCDLFYCPECQPGLSRDRKSQVEWWTKTIAQPKHVVLTVRNIPDLTRGHVDQLHGWFNKIRRRKFARNWVGGFFSIECTNEGAGWHLHIHALVDAKWIDAPELARQWESVTNGMGRIVKVMDCRRVDYLAEVTKYAVKGSQLAKWSTPDVAAFVRAFDGKRTFGVFGSLYGVRTEFAEFIATLKAAKAPCSCGSCNVSYFSEAEWLERELKSPPASSPRPPPALAEAELPIHIFQPCPN